MKDIARNMVIAGVLATGVTYAWYVGVVKARKDVYAEFHRTLDVDAMYERMKSKGVFWAFKAIEEYEAEQAGEAEGEEEEAEGEAQLFLTSKVMEAVRGRKYPSEAKKGMKELIY